MNFYTQQHKHSCGIDLHARAMYVCILDQNGTKLVHKNLPTTPEAFLRVSEEMQHIYPEIAGEFYTVVMQVKAGQERSRAFQSLVRRTGIEDIKSLAAMIVQSERFGTSLSQALKVYAEALRTKRRLRAEAAVGKAGLKITFAVVLFILPALFVVALVPGVLSALRDLRGGIGAR